MPFHKVTYNEKHRFATVHNYGCTFKCPICSYKLKSGEGGTPGHSHPAPEKFLAAATIKDVLRTVSVDTVYFMGGEPTVATDLPELLDFAKNQLHVRTFLGHTNGSKLPLANLDGANVGLKAWNERLHLEYTGRPRQMILDNFAAAHAAGLEMRANVVYIPNYVDLDQVESIARWVGDLDSAIPFHIMGYIPVPGQNFSSPTPEQMEMACNIAGKYLVNVSRTLITSRQALDLSSRDDRFEVRRIA